MSYRQSVPPPLLVLTVDSRYPTPAFLSGLRDYPDLLVIAQVRCKRSFYQLPEAGRSSTRPHAKSRQLRGLGNFW